MSHNCNIGVTGLLLRLHCVAFERMLSSDRDEAEDSRRG